MDGNLLVVLGATVVAFLLGWLWYSPVLFGKQWLALMGWSEAEVAERMKEGGRSMVINFVATFVAAYVLMYVVQMMGGGLTVGVRAGLLMWLAFNVTTQLNPVLWEGKSWKLFWLGAGHSLVSYALMGAIIGHWG